MTISAALASVMPAGVGSYCTVPAQRPVECKELLYVKFILRGNKTDELCHPEPRRPCATFCLRDMYSCSVLTKRLLRGKSISPVGAWPGRNTKTTLKVKCEGQSYQSLLTFTVHHSEFTNISSVVLQLLCRQTDRQTAKVKQQLLYSWLAPAHVVITYNYQHNDSFSLSRNLVADWQGYNLYRTYSFYHIVHSFTVICGTVCVF